MKLILGLLGIVSIILLVAIMFVSAYLLSKSSTGTGSQYASISQDAVHTSQNWYD